MNFGFLLFPGVEELDLVGPWEMVSVWSQFAQGPENRFLIAEGNTPVSCAKGMVIEQTQHSPKRRSLTSFWSQAERAL